MKTILLATLSFAAGLTLSATAGAQDHSQHQMPAMQDHGQHQMPPMDHPQHQQHEPKPKAEPKPKPKAKPATPASHTDEMDHAAMGHDVPLQDAEPLDHAAMGHAMPRAPGEPITPIPALTDADRAAAVPPPSDHPVHDNSIQSFVLFNRLEGFHADEGRGLEWEGQAWVGTDLDKLWLRSEGEHSGGRTRAADLEVLYGRSIARWWNLVAGVRHDFKPGGSQDFAAIGVQGLAPYRFEVEATAYIGESGRTAARIEAEYETLLTNRLVLQPLVEANFNGQDDAHRGIGSGLGTIEAGLRLRYEITRRFAPYIGVVRERAFGRTADFRRDAGGDVDDTRFVAGFRIWF